VRGGAVVRETARLRIRRATEVDADVYLALWTDPRVMANVGFPQGLRITREEIVERLRREGDGPFERMLVAERKDTAEVVGECFLHLPDAEGVAGTDVKLLPEHWGHRYGLEIKQALVDLQFEETDAAAVRATPNVGNVASIKMQEAVGGVRVGETHHEFPEDMRGWTVPLHLYEYRVHRADWESRRVSRLLHSPPSVR
jgi:RimJ/RimL family protein N-acetyltransferase